MRTRPLTMNAALGLALLALVALAAAVALADPDPGRTAREPAPPAQPPAHGDAPPPLAINQAEITRGVPEDPDAARQAAAAAATAATKAAAPDATVVPPMIAEIRATLDAAHAAVAELQARLPGLVDPGARHALQQRIAARKQQAERDILGIQAREARARDDQALATELEAAIAALLAPPAPTPPAEPRPAPAGQR